MKYLLTLFLLSTSAYAEGNYSLFEIEKLEITHSKMAPGTRDLAAPWYTGSWYSKSELEWRINMFKFIYLDNNMHMEMIDPTTVKTVGWKHELGIRLLDSVSLFWGHHSRHILDEAGPQWYQSGNQFPVEDYLGIRLKIVEEKVGRGLFK